MNRFEELLTALINGEDIGDWVPLSRLEEYLVRCCKREKADDIIPLTRTEVLLRQLAATIAEGGGGGEDMLQTLINITNSCYQLFYKYGGANVDFIKNLDTSNVTNMEGMFKQSKQIQTIPLINTSNVINMRYMFSECENLLSIPQLNTSNVTDMGNMFQYCEVLTTIPQLNTSNVTSMWYMFSQCHELISIPQLNTSNVTGMGNMFYNCTKLISIPQLNVSNVTSMDGMFAYCRKLKSILMYGMKVNFSIYYSDEFEASDLVTILSNCQVVTSSQTLTMGSTNLAKLDGVYVKPTGVELYEGITCNPCVICESTEEGAVLAIDYMTSKGWTLA